jgi:hypothetical protein
MIMKYFNIKQSVLAASFIALASFFGTLNTYAEPARDSIIFGNASGILPAGIGFPFDTRVRVPSGIVFTSVDGSTNPLDFRDNAKGADTVYTLDTNEVIIKIPHVNICLSVSGNKAILWHRFTETHLPFCIEGEIALGVYDLDTNTVTAQNISQSDGIYDIESCGPNDIGYLRPPFQVQLSIDKVNGGVMVHDGV